MLRDSDGELIAAEAGGVPAASEALNSKAVAVLNAISQWQSVLVVFALLLPLTAKFYKVRSLPLTATCVTADHRIYRLLRTR